MRSQNNLIRFILSHRLASSSENNDSESSDSISEEEYEWGGGDSRCFNERGSSQRRRSLPRWRRGFRQNSSSRRTPIHSYSSSSWGSQQNRMKENFDSNNLEKSLSKPIA